MNSKKIKLQINIWNCLAKVLPLSVLGFLFLTHTVGKIEIYGDTIVYGGTVFFAAAVTWWWWAMDKIKGFVLTLDDTADKLLNITQEVRKVKNEIKDGLDSRKRGK